MQDNHLQAFKTATSKIISIPTRQDPKSGQRIVRWQDILQFFGDVRGILNGEDAVLFLTTDDLEDLIPHRIAYHPGVVLQVLVVETPTTPCPLHSLSYHTTTPADACQSTHSNVALIEELQELKQQTQQMQLQIEEIQQMTNTPRRPRLSEIGADKENNLPALRTLSCPDFIRDRVQALLGTPLDGSPAPRFFVVLPKDPNPNDSQETLGSWVFQVHFLCECDSHSEAGGSKGSHEVHMMNHAGYGIKHPKEFFEKYGPHVLTVMYMIKHGSVSSGFVVPPLTRSNMVSRIEESQGHPSSIKRNIVRLVDDSIAYLEEVTRTTVKGIGASPCRNLNLTDLEELNSYLEVGEGVHFPSGLHQLTSQGYSSWVCIEHQCGWTVQRLKESVNATRGTFTEKSGMIDIKVASDNMTKRFYNAVIEFCRTQCSHEKLRLSVDCGRLSLTADANQGSQDVAVTIKHLTDLTMDDIDFIQQCNITKLTIKHTPKATDESQLANILQTCPQLKELYIGCLGDRVLIIINFVISTREKSLQNGKPIALRTFQVADEELAPFDWYRTWDKQDHIEATLSFSDDSIKFDMDTRMVLQTDKAVTESDWMSNFFRQYGWSISYLITAWQFNDHLAGLLDVATQTHGSKLTRLHLSQFSITSAGLDSMERIINRSQCLVYPSLFFHGLQVEPQREKAMTTLERFGAKSNELWFIGDTIELWVPHFAKAFPTRSCFPKLETLVLECSSKREFPCKFVPWLVDMVSSQPHLGDPCTEAPQETTRTLMLQTRLKIFGLNRITLLPQEWETLIKAIDFTDLLHLSFMHTNFSREQLVHLIDSIAGTGAKSVPLNRLDLTGADLLANADKRALRERIHKVAPQVTIHGL
ncbi:hypothetical protein B0O80DRAFT_275073 [Mortierella sp. GBAus27b]|nr:hypothetical protein BGX31_005005 [Mortierella sp. GBA43]KAI8358145.1 hypothetical protein B0O80DRAFT_275073 [Mortierella sp. GBAus27b]